MQKVIVAIHGAGAHAGVWKSLRTQLEEYAFLTLSLPGHDPASKAEPLSSIDEMAAWVKKQLSDVPKDSVILTGHSMGALVALETANDPAVHALVLIGAAAKMPVNPDLLKTALETPVKAAEMIAKWGVHAANAEAEAVKNLLDKTMKAGDRRALGRDLAACNDYTVGEVKARSLKRPALVIAGAEDKMIKPEKSRELADLIVGGRYYTVSSCGHMIMIEKPEETSFAMRQFLEETLAGDQF